MRKLTGILLLLLSFAPAFAAPEKASYKVRLSGGSVKADAGDRLELSLKMDLITAVDKTCKMVRSDSTGNVDCTPETQNVVVGSA